jgi:hypothetical protein
VGFRAVDESEVKVPFESGDRRRLSPYREALNQIVLGKAKVLCFESVRARNSIVLQARKANLKGKVLFAEQDGRLYVKLNAENSSASIVLQMIRESHSTKREMVAELSARRLHDIKLEEELKTLADNGLIRLTGDSRWVIAK